MIYILKKIEKKILSKNCLLNFIFFKKKLKIENFFLNFIFYKNINKTIIIIFLKKYLKESGLLIFDYII